MKKLFLFFSILFSVMPFMMKAEELTIGDGVNYTYGAPFNNYYLYSWNEAIYLSDEIGGKCAITSISYHCAKGYPIGTNLGYPIGTNFINIYMGETSRSSISSVTDWTPESDLTLVYSGENIVLGDAEWEEFVLDVPFDYSGGGNLVIVVAKSGKEYSSNLYWNITNTDERRCIYRQSDGDESCAQHPGDAEGYAEDYFPNIKLNVEYVSLSLSPIVVDQNMDIAFPAGVWSDKLYTFDIATAGELSQIDAIESTNPNIVVSDIKYPKKIYKSYALSVGLSLKGVEDANEINGQLNVKYTDSIGQHVAVVNVSAVSYTPTSPDVWELAEEITSYPFSDTPTNLNDDYSLPGDTKDGADAVYRIVIEEDVLISANVSGTDAKLALYNEDFDGEPGPDKDNAIDMQDYSYTGYSFDNYVLFSGTYYLVASATSEFTVDVNVEQMPLPVKISEPVRPKNMSNDVMVDDELFAYPDLFAKEYQILLGTTNPPVDVFVDWTSDKLKYEFSDMQPNMIYYWQVNQRNSSGVTYGDVWQFTTWLTAPMPTLVNDLICEGDDVVLAWEKIDSPYFNGCYVYLDGTILDTVATDTTYVISDLPRGEYTVALQANYDMGTALSEDLDFVVAGQGYVMGHVYEQDGFTPIANASISVSGKEVSLNIDINENGEFGKKLYEGTYKLEASMDGYQNSCKHINIPYNDTVYVDFILNENYYPVAFVEAEINSDSNVDVLWSRGEQIRAFSYYNVYRQNTVTKETVLLEDSVTVMEYTDMSWDTLAMGGYKYGVSASYEGNKQTTRQKDVKQNDIKPFVPEEDFVPQMGTLKNTNVFTSSRAAKYSKNNSSLRGNLAYANVSFPMDMPGGYVSFDWDNLSCENVSVRNDVYVDRGGEYYDGAFYGYGSNYVFYKLNPYTGDVIEEYNVDAWVNEMAYDYSRKTMYGVNETNLFNVNLDNGELTMVGQFPVSIAAFGIDLNGNAYGVEFGTGDFYSLDLETMECILVGSTGLGCNYIQCGGFNHNEGDDVFYWFQCYDIYNMGFYAIDVTNGTPSLLLENTGEVTSWFVPYTHKKSFIVWSETLDIDMITSVEISVTTNSGDSPEGTLLTLENVNEKEVVYNITLDDTGVFSDDKFRKGNYKMTISKDGFATEVNDNVDIWNEYAYNTVLTEIINPVKDLFVSSTGWAMWKHETTKNRAFLHYEILLNDSLVAETSKNYYQYENLIDSTTYTTKVVAVYSTGNSDSISYSWFKLPVELFPALTELNAEYTNEGVSLSWMSPIVEDDSTTNTEDGIWKYYDTGEWVSGIGGTQAVEFSWGIKLRAEDLEDCNYLTKVAVFDDVATSGTFDIFLGGDEAPAGASVHNQEYVLTDANEYAEFELIKPVEINGENVWIIFNTKEGQLYPASVSNNTGDADGRWVSLDGNWADLYEDYGLNCTWMLRGYFEEDVEVDLDILGFMAYRNGELITNEPIADSITAFIDKDGEDGDNYCVKVVYDGLKRKSYYAMSEEICVEVDYVMPAVPVNLTAEATSTSSITLSWNTAEYAQSYNVYQDDELLTNVTENTYIVEDLEYNKEYCFTVTAVRKKNESEKSEEVCVKTLGENIEDLTLSLDIYPNPAENEIRISSDEVIEEVAIYGVSGILLHSEQCAMNNVALINVSDFNAGTYIIKVRTANDNVIRYFVKM